MQNIIDNIESTSFPDNNFNILDYGAISDGIYDNTKVFNKALQACSKSGGSYVIVPKGKFLSAAMHLENNVNLHLEEGSEIVFGNIRTKLWNRRF